MPRAALKSIALPLARRAEGLLERIGDRDDDAPVLEPYLGYATPDGLVLRGRVLSHIRRDTPDATQSKWTNVRQMVQLFVTDEVADVAVEAEGVTAVSDTEGYIRLVVARAASAGWTDVPVRIVGSEEPAVAFPARVPGPDAAHLVISDIDDTVIETGAHSLARNLWTTFTGSALTRTAHHDAKRLMEALVEEDRNPVFYVSSSPWNLHDFLEALFERHDLPRGPKFLRDLGITEEGVGASHGTHKGSAIDEILAANPTLPAYLMGDSGQKDAIVYRDAIRRHPGRILGVALREPAPGEGDDDAQAIAEIEALGVPCFHGPSFDGARHHWGLQ
ncbi:phosphatase domain-containing protein [Jannaschia seohaensis]|uniref:Phosphatidate phosphatase APP1 n=1 Tax=Jannaschia seohaensis TaxID=475081 RepID=A0A2Y9B0A9_9RHOB|nr:phosphatase domain-containing protein [Jannaschia seohaensis]PWJ15052.1 phosphatidate phosphatase APP1 [Jannaschia seohaensis]SSA49901.1 Phosphatidate phosphatase APP1 [Jannaschia seohaensis]